MIVIKSNFISLLKNRVIINDLFQLTLLNGVFGGLTPIFILFLQHKTGYAGLQAIMISVLSGLITVFMLFGNALTSKILKKVSNFILGIVANIFVIGVGAGFLMDNIWIILFFASFIALLLGTISPRFSATVINTFPTQNLGGIVTTVNSFLVLTPPVTSLLFPLLANIGLIISYSGFIIYGLLLIIVSSSIYPTIKNK